MCLLCLGEFSTPNASNGGGGGGGVGSIHTEVFN